jgi:hypothetical protein
LDAAINKAIERRTLNDGLMQADEALLRSDLLIARSEFVATEASSPSGRVGRSVAIQALSEYTKPIGTDVTAAMV